VHCGETRRNEWAKAHFSFGAARISCHAAITNGMYAAFRKESRMKLVKANNFDRKSGGARLRGGIFILKRQLWH
jgi:hypothetical protein